MATMTMASENSSRTTWDEKTPGKKGKGVNPWNWGGVRLNNDERSPEVQRAAL